MSRLLHLIEKLTSTENVLKVILLEMAFNFVDGILHSTGVPAYHIEVTNNAMVMSL